MGYEATIHGQDVTVTVLPPGVAEGANPAYRPNVKVRSYKYEAQPNPKQFRRKRRRSKRTFVRVGKVHPDISQEV